MSTKIVIAIKILLFLIYAVIAFVGLFVVLFLDDPALNQSFFAQFLFPLYFLFILAAIASFFLPLKFSFLPPVIILSLFFLTFHLTYAELEKIKGKNQPAIQSESEESNG